MIGQAFSVRQLLNDSGGGPGQYGATNYRTIKEYIQLNTSR